MNEQKNNKSTIDDADSRAIALMQEIVRLLHSELDKFDSLADDGHSLAWHGICILENAIKYLLSEEITYNTYFPIYTREKEIAPEAEKIATEEIECKKPPMGVLPRHLWLEQRRIELARAIYERLHFDFTNPKSRNNDLIRDWIFELLIELPK